MDSLCGKYGMKIIKTFRRPIYVRIFIPEKIQYEEID